AAAAAMGAENAIFIRAGEVQLGLTYMTGTIVKFSQRLALALMGRKATGWLPFLLLWCGLIVGAVAGALVYRFAGAAGFLIAAAVAETLAFFSPRFLPA